MFNIFPTIFEVLLVSGILVCILNAFQLANSWSVQFILLQLTCNSPEAREKSRVHGAIGFGFCPHWLKNWRECFKPITKRSNRNHVITFDSHLKTALYAENNYAVSYTHLTLPTKLEV